MKKKRTRYLGARRSTVVFVSARVQEQGQTFKEMIEELFFKAPDAEKTTSDVLRMNSVFARFPRKMRIFHHELNQLEQEMHDRGQVVQRFVHAQNLRRRRKTLKTGVGKMGAYRRTRFHVVFSYFEPLPVEEITYLMSLVDPDANNEKAASIPAWSNEEHIGSSVVTMVRKQMLTESDLTRLRDFLNHDMDGARKVGTIISTEIIR